MSELSGAQPISVNETVSNRPLQAAGREPEVTPPPLLETEQPTEVISYEPGEARFTLESLKKYANPVNAAKSFRGFVVRTVKRFKWPEVNGTITALLGAHLANKYGYNSWATAFAGAQAENIGFYGTTITQRYRELRKEETNPYTRTEAATETLRYLVGSFALAEAIDFPVRPILMDVAQQAAEHVPTVLAVGAGKAAADLIFYKAVDPMVKRHYKKAEQRKMHKLQEQTPADETSSV